MNSPHAEILNVVDKMDQEANAIRQQCIKMSWYMRGGVSYEEAMNMSYTERNMISDLIKDNLETTNKTRLPFF